MSENKSRKKSIIVFTILIALTLTVLIYTGKDLILKKFKNNEAFGILLLNVEDIDAKELKPSYLCVVYIYPNTSRLGFISLYPGTYLSEDNASLKEQIKYNKIQDVQNELSNRLQIPIRDYIVTDYSIIAKATDLVEGIPYFNSTNSTNIPNLPNGEFMLDGSMIPRLLSSKSKNEGASAEQLFAHLSLFLNFWNHKENKWNLLYKTSLLQLLLKEIKTSLNIDEIAMIGNMIFSDNSWMPIFMEIPVKRKKERLVLDIDASAVYLKNFKKMLSSAGNPFLQEPARVEIKNGTGHANLAKKTARLLSRKGAIVVEFSNADHHNYKNSILLDIGAKPFYALSLAKTLGIKKTYATVNKSTFTDVIFIVGADHQKHNMQNYE